MVSTRHVFCSYFYYICVFRFGCLVLAGSHTNLVHKFFLGGILLVPNPKTEKYSIPDLLDVAVSSSQAIMVA